MKRIWTNGCPHMGEAVRIVMEDSTVIVGLYGGYDDKSETYLIYPVLEYGNEGKKVVRVRKNSVYKGKILK
jgi:hypothetical protein